MIVFVYKTVSKYNCSLLKCQKATHTLMSFKKYLIVSIQYNFMTQKKHQIDQISKQLHARTIQLQDKVKREVDTNSQGKNFIFDIEVEANGKKTSILGTQLKAASQNKESWSKDELKTFRNLYFQHGSNWVEISKKLGRRTVSSLKNYFGDSLRKLSNKIDDHSQILGIRGQRNSKAHLLTLLQIINQAQRHIKSLNLTLNPESSLIRLKFLIVQLCFQKELIDAYIGQLIKLSRALGSKLKCLRIFKVRNRKSWRLTLQSFSKILLFDPIVTESIQQILDKDNRQNKIVDLPSLDDSSIVYQLPASDEYQLIQIDEDFEIQKSYSLSLLNNQEQHILLQ